MYDQNYQNRIKLNNQIKEWNAIRLDLFHISEPNEYLEFYGVMRYFYQGDDLKYHTKCLRVSSTATTIDVIEALVLKFNPDLKMLNNDKYVLFESHKVEERRLKNDEHPLVVQLNWAFDDKDGKFILRNETRRRRSIDIQNSAYMSNNGMLRSSSTIMNGNDNQAVRTQSSSEYRRAPNFFSKRFKSARKSSKSNRESFEKAKNEKMIKEEINGKPPESSFTRTISNPDDVMKRRRQKKLESRLEQFSGVKGDGETGGTLKIYGDSINPDIPYKTLLLSVNDTAEKVLSETLDKYGLSYEDHRFYVLVQQNIPPRDDKNRGNIEEIILHDQDCPLGILVHCPPKRGSATFAVRRATPLDQFPVGPRLPPFTFRKKSVQAIENDNNNDTAYVEENPSNVVECPRLRKLFVDADGSLYDEENGIFPLSSLVDNAQNNESSNYGTKFIKIGSQPSSIGEYPNILLPFDYYNDIRPIHCHISVKQDSQSNSIKFQLTPTLDSTSRTPRPCVMFINQQRIDCSTQIINGDIIQLGESVIFKFEEFDDETEFANDQSGLSQERSEESGESLQISYFTADLPVTVKYKYKKSKQLVDKIIQFSKEYAKAGRKKLFSSNIKFEINNLDETFRLSPAYMMYLVIRAGLSNNEQIIQLVDLIADRIYQVIQEDRNNVEEEVFWLSNSSELLHLLQYDNDLRNYSVGAQDILATAIEQSFSFVQHQFSQDLMVLLPALLSEDDLDLNDNTQEDNIPCLDRSSILTHQGIIDYPIQHLLQTLSLAFNLFHNCQVNVALTIQMFSQLFHLLNTWLFNSVLGESSNCNSNDNGIPVCQEWGNRLTRRLNRIRYWSEVNGLEMAANCHLQKMYQVAELMESDKRDLNMFGEKCIEMVNLNGAQLYHLLINCQDYDLPDAWVDVVVNTAIQLHDQAFNNNVANAFPQNKNTLPLYEDMDLRLPLLLPADGYCCDRGIVSCPKDLKSMLRFLKDSLLYRLNPPVLNQMDTRWKSYLGTCESTPTVSRTNTIIEQQLSTPLKSEVPYLPRNWVNNIPQNEVISTSETLSSKRERYQKKTINNSLSQYSEPQLRPSLPPHIKKQNRYSFDIDETDEKSSKIELRLTKIENSIGLSIISARVSNNDIYRIYVKEVINKGAAFKSGKISTGDQLLSIDGTSLDNKLQDEAVVLMKKTKSDVVLVVDKGAALRHGVLDMIIQAKNNKVSSSSQKSQHVTNSQKPLIKKNLTKNNHSLKQKVSKEEPQIKNNISKLRAPSLTTEKVPPRPPRVQNSNNLKPTYRKVSDDALNFNSLPDRKSKSKEAPLPEIPIYATVKKGPSSKNKVDVDYYPLQKYESNPVKFSSQPNLNKITSMSKKNNESTSIDSSSSGSSASLSSTDEEIPIRSNPPTNRTNNKQYNSALELRIPKPNTSKYNSISPLSKPTSEMNIQSKSLGIPRHEVSSKQTEVQSNPSKKQLFSRPLVAQNQDSITIINYEEQSETISLKKPVPRKDYALNGNSSSSESETISSNTEATTSSDHSPLPQKKITNGAPLKTVKNTFTTQQEPKPSKDTSVPVRKLSTGTGNLGGFKRPDRLSIGKSTEQITNFSTTEFVQAPKMSHSSMNLKVKTPDNEVKFSTPAQVKSYSPFSTVPPPPAPTALYPQYHPPNKNEGNKEINDIKEMDASKPPSVEEIKMRRQEMADRIRQQSEEKEKNLQLPYQIENKPMTLSDDVKISSNATYGRPQFKENSAVRPVSLFKPESSSVPSTNLTEVKSKSVLTIPMQGIVISPSSALKSRVIGSNEIYRDPYTMKINQSTELNKNEEAVETLSFREKMKMFAEKSGEGNVIDRKKFSSKQRRIDSGDFTY